MEAEIFILTNVANDCGVIRNLINDFKGKLIDATEGLSKNANANFFTSDSHWNQKGARIWLDQLNRQLQNVTYLGN